MHLNNVHRVNVNDIKTFRRLCASNSYFFSNSEAFINTYINSHNSAFCYNDGRSIFFFNHFGDDTYFFCCPKGNDWPGKIFQVIFNLKEKFNKDFRKIWLWELPCSLSEDSLRNKKFLTVEPVIRERYLSHLAEFRDLSLYLAKRSSLRRKWNKFFNFLYKSEEGKQIVEKVLSKTNYRDVIKLLDLWKTEKDKVQRTKDDNILDHGHVFRKNVRVVKDALRRPELYESLVLYCNGYPQGIIIGLKIEKSKNISGSVICTNGKIPNTSEILCLLFLKMLAQKGYKYLNWGNSHSDSIEAFKRQFHPRKQEYSYEYFIKFKE